MGMISKTGILWILILTTGLVRSAVAQEEHGKVENQEGREKETFTRVTLGSTSGKPDSSVMIPIYVTPAQNVEVGRLKLEVSYVSANLKFAKLDPGIGAQLSDLHLDTAVKDGKNDKGVGTQTVVISVSLPSSETPKKGIPAGLLAYLMLRISENGRPASITVRASAEADALGTNKPLANIKTENATLDVVAPSAEPLPSINCFFFTH